MGLFLDKNGFISDYLIKTKKNLINSYLNPDYKFNIDVNKLPNKDVKEFIKLVRANTPLLLKTPSSWANPSVYYTLNDLTNKRLFGDDNQNQTESDIEFKFAVNLNNKFEVSLVKEPKKETQLTLEV